MYCWGSLSSYIPRIGRMRYVLQVYVVKYVPELTLTLQWPSCSISFVYRTTCRCRIYFLYTNRSFLPTQDLGYWAADGNIHTTFSRSSRRSESCCWSIWSSTWRLSCEYVVCFAKIRKKNRHIWSKAEQAVRTTAKNQRACQTATRKVHTKWGEAKATEILAINTAQGWRGAVSRLATACVDYDQAMSYIVHALVQRLRHVGRGKSRYLDPGVVDIQRAMDLYKETPRRPLLGMRFLLSSICRGILWGCWAQGPKLMALYRVWASSIPHIPYPRMPYPHWRKQ